MMLDKKSSLLLDKESSICCLIRVVSMLLDKESSLCCSKKIRGEFVDDEAELSGKSRH